MERNTKEDPNRKILFGVLSGLALIIVGLVAVIAIVANNRDTENNQNKRDDESKYLSGVELCNTNEEIIEANCLANEDIYEVSSCIENDDDEFVTEESWDVDAVYKEAVEILEKGENYTEAIQLISYQAIELAVDGDCAGALTIFENTDLTKYSELLKAVFYGNAIGVSNLCQDTVSAEKWTEKRDEAMDNE